MNTQSEALRLAGLLVRRQVLCVGDGQPLDEAAAELRRLHSENQLLETMNAQLREQNEAVGEACAKREAEIEATDRQVEILSDALSESRRINAELLEALKAIPLNVALKADDGVVVKARAAIARAEGGQP